MCDILQDLWQQSPDYEAGARGGGGGGGDGREGRVAIVNHKFQTNCYIFSNLLGPSCC